MDATASRHAHLPHNRSTYNRHNSPDDDDDHNEHFHELNPADSNGKP